jgi:hypothetical protein
VPRRLIPISLPLALVIGCAGSPKPPPQSPKLPAMIAAIEALRKQASQNGSTRDIRFFISIAPTQLNTTVQHSSGDDTTGYERYEIVYSDETIAKTDVASLTQVLLDRNGVLETRSDLYIWEQGSWINTHEWLKRHNPAALTEDDAMKQWRSLFYVVPPERSPAGPTSKP